VSAVRLALALAGAALLAGCAGGARTGVAVATADGTARYEGERMRRAGADAFALTATRGPSAGAACEGELYPTTDTTTGQPASFGGVSCDDGRVGMLLFAGERSAGGGAVSGVIDRRSVKGRWGSRPAIGSGGEA
jgi:hypothetical protein